MRPHICARLAGSVKNVVEAKLQKHYVCGTFTILEHRKTAGEATEAGDGGRPALVAGADNGVKQGCPIF